MKNIFGWLKELMIELLYDLRERMFERKEINIAVIADYCTITKNENVVYGFDTRMKKNFCIIKRV